MAPRICPHCWHSFTPSARGARGRQQPTCGLKACRDQQKGLTRRGKAQPRMRATKRRQANERIRARLRKQFGELSVREIEVFRFAWKTAQKRGYDVARRRNA